MRLLTIATLFLLLSFQANAQNFEPAPSKTQDKLELFMKRFGYFHRVYLKDKDKKTFEATPGKEYFLWFVYDVNSKVVRRIMVHQLGENGEKVKIHYPKTSQSVTDGNYQAFGAGFVTPGEDNRKIIYKVDTNAEANVYIYEVTRGVKRD